MAAGPPKTSELIDLSAVDAVASMKRGDFSAEEYAAALLERCGAGKSLNAFIALDPERVILNARRADEAVPESAQRCQ